MKQREVQDDSNVRWTCVQALSSASGAAAEAAAERLADGDGKVPVVCTPSGGETSVRVELPHGWEDALSDEELLEAISAAQRG
ncbi:hypothetical protein [Caldimonas tepidiphila]|uniref:hypothetical protein n=1 Tax=Caldimonas tepidiphila TaxID=2315841 RepID=UPI000E5AE077|nr:hypothetical protein [Caldimonas tepidiphila]